MEHVFIAINLVCLAKFRDESLGYKLIDYIIDNETLESLEDEPTMTIMSIRLKPIGCPNLT